MLHRAAHTTIIQALQMHCANSMTLFMQSRAWRHCFNARLRVGLAAGQAASPATHRSRHKRRPCSCQHSTRHCAARNAKAHCLRLASRPDLLRSTSFSQGAGLGCGRRGHRHGGRRGGGLDAEQGDGRLGAAGRQQQRQRVPGERRGPGRGARRAEQRGGRPDDAQRLAAHAPQLDRLRARPPGCSSECEGAVSQTENISIYIP